MQRSVSIALLGLTLLSAVTMQGQKNAAAFHGGSPRVGGPSPGIFGHGCCRFNRPFSHSFVPSNFPGVFVTGPYYPFWYDEPSPHDQPNYQPATAAPMPLPVVPGESQNPAPAAPSAKVIDVPGTTEKPAAPKLQLPVVFVLVRGERLEARRYTLTADFLSVDDNGHRRRLPVAALDREATLAANRQRGIELKFPSDPNEISLGF